VGRAAGVARSLVVPALVLAGWELVSRVGWVSPIILPAPSQVFLRWIAYARPYAPYDPAAGSFAAWLLSGELPHDAIVRSPSSGSTLTVHALDNSSIWVLGIRVGGTDYDGSQPLSVSVGESVLVELTASDRSGAHIPGNPPAPPTWQVRGSSVVEASSSTRGAWFRGESGGESTILFQWGDAQAALTIDVTP